MPPTGKQRQMPMTDAEKQRRYRQKQKEKYSEAAKENECKRWHHRKAMGKVQTFNDLTPREKRAKEKQ